MIKEVIAESGLKYKYIAEALGISRYSLQRKIENKAEFRGSEIQALCKILKITSLTKREAIFFKNEVDL